MATVCLIRPPMIDLRYMYNTIACPPVGLAYVAASARAAGHTVRVIDAVGEAPDQRVPLNDPRFMARGLTVPQVLNRIPADVDVLAVSCMFSQDWPHVRGILEALRRAFPTTAIVAGGEHVTAMPEFILGEGTVDHCVLGEGEETFVDLIDALAGGRPTAEVPGVVTRADGAIVRTARRSRIAAVDDIPEPAWDLFPIENYLGHGLGFGVNRGRSMPIVATRGCPYQCTFCSSPTMWTTKWTARDPEKLLAEMRGYMERYGAQNFDFYDLTAIIKRDWIVAFCKLVLASGVKFTWQLPTGTRSEAIDEEVASLLYQTGCRNICYAPESGSATELRRIKKKVKVPSMLASMRGSARQGLYVKANLVIGFPGQTRRELLETMWFIARMAMVGVRDIMISLFSPYPGSELYGQLRAAGKIGEPNDEYFSKLSCYIDVTQSISWSDKLTDRDLAIGRWFGMVMFYVLSFTLRPWRALATLRNVWADRQESVMDRALGDFVRRALSWTARRRRGAALPAPPPAA